MDDAPLSDDGVWRGWPWLVVAALVAAAVHAPCLQLGFVGDDFEWWLAARTALEEPSRLIAPYGGFRPVNLWILAADQLLWGTEPVGYHATSIVLHIVCGMVLWRVFRRFDFAPMVAAGLTILWMCSPYTLKPVLSLCERFQPVLLMTWLGLLLVWPGSGETWTRRRGISAAALIALSALVKESWVVVPGFVLCFELALRRTGVVRAVRTAQLPTVAVLAYVVLYVLNPPISTSYYARTLAPAAKVPHSWAVFMGLTPLDPGSSQLGLAEAVAGLVILVLAWWGWRRRCEVTAVGMAFFVLPFLPVLPVNFLVTRYTYIPLVGFLLVVAAAVRASFAHVPVRLRSAAVASLVLAAALFFLHGLAWLRGDLVDADRRDEAHRRLLAEARAFVSHLPREGLIVGARLERESPNRALLEHVEGIPKAYYERTRNPYSLIKWAPLFSYVLDSEGGPLYERVRPAGGTIWTVVGHTERGFVKLPQGGATITESVEHWQQQGAFVEAFRPRPWQKE